MKQPIIIIGMHRSGTSMLTRTLQAAGLFMGKYREKNDESLYFLEINNWILKQTNATWDNPYCYSFNNRKFKEAIKRVFRIRSKFFAYKYLGWNNYFKYRTLDNIDFKWGWKDPRNSFTIDIWKEIYPSAKIIHIYRNPVDVANSLKVRAEKLESSYKNNIFKRLREVFLKGKTNYTHSYRVLNLEEGYKLWKEYTLNCLNVDNALHIKYEDLLSCPNKYLKEIFSFINLDISDKELEIHEANFDISRKYAFTDRDDLVEFYSSIKNDQIMKTLSYDKLDECYERSVLNSPNEKI